MEIITINIVVKWVKYVVKWVMMVITFTTRVIFLIITNISSMTYMLIYKMAFMNRLVSLPCSIEL